MYAYAKPVWMKQKAEKETHTHTQTIHRRIQNARDGVLTELVCPIRYAEQERAIPRELQRAGSAGVSGAGRRCRARGRHRDRRYAARVEEGVPSCRGGKEAHPTLMEVVSATLQDADAHLNDRGDARGSCHGIASHGGAPSRQRGVDKRAR